MKTKLKFFSLSLRNLLLLCSLASFFLLATALVGQYGFNLHPCELCIYQRIPYAIIIVLGLVGAFAFKSKRWQFIIAVICALLFLVDAGIAGYHAGVELEIFPGPTACSSDGKVGQTLEEMRAEIMGAPLVTCAQAMIYVWGLSMAAWNMIAALICFFTSSFVIFKCRK